MKIFLVLFIIFVVSCDKKNPKEKAYDYIWYLDAFYFDLTGTQENKLKSIVDFYFEKSIPINKLNKKIYQSVSDSLINNKKDLEITLIYEILLKRRKLQEPIIKAQLNQINEFYQSLSIEQKKELFDKLDSFKNKSARFKFMLGDS
jgi:hypothetical protein